MNIDRDTALRIAMAERTLPDVDLTTLIGILDERLGPPSISTNARASRSPT